MDAPSIVVAFSESHLLRETLAVLLEHDCELRFLNPDSALIPDTLDPALALVATPATGRFLHDLTSRWPMIPIVAVEMPDAPARGADTPADPRVRSVPLEPHAIRDAVRQELAVPTDGALRASVQRVTEALRGELAYAFTALRSFSALPATSAAAETAPIIGAVLREQSHVLDECVALLQRFRTRPRRVEISAQFVATLCRELAKPETLAARGMRCVCAIDAPPPQAAGPTALAPLIAAFLHAHLRRRSDASSIPVQGTPNNVIIRYPLRASAPARQASWPLLLASLALQPWSWRVGTTTDGHEETVTLCPGT